MHLGVSRLLKYLMLDDLRGLKEREAEMQLAGATGPAHPTGSLFSTLLVSRDKIGTDGNWQSILRCGPTSAPFQPGGAFL